MSLTEEQVFESKKGNCRRFRCIRGYNKTWIIIYRWSGADSLDTVELVMALEEEFGTEIADEEAEKLTTVKKP